MPSHADEIRKIRTFPSLVKYLRDELEWPIEGESFEDLTFDYEPDELGLDAKSAVKVKEIKQLRPLADGQPWGIFFVSFEQKKLPIVVLRRILRALVVKKRESANRSQQAVWSLHDLLFISSFGEKDHRELTLAHFSEPHDRDLGDLPTLHVLGWDEDDTRLKLDKVAQKLNEDLHWPEDPSNVEGWREKWSHAFKLRVREVVSTSQDLAVRLAGLAQRIRKRANSVLSHESDNGPLRKLHKGFQAALIHDLSEDDFADMYAQTITYGLFSAACSRPAGVIAENLADMVPVTNPFLKETLETFLTVGGRKGRIDFDELGIQEVVDLLNSKDTHLEAVLRDFGNRRQQEDPVIHFYELFLKEYDNAKKVQRGVFYTPQPVVSYIVRSVHELLQTEFGLEDGLASTVTWGEMAKRTKGLEIPKGTKPDQPFVTILDPATGTATFLVEVVDLIHRTMITKWEKEGWRESKRQDAWNEYVPNHLLPRLHGYELMMAPYAIAHMKIGLKLVETGYAFGSAERARIFLTNALEPAQELPKLLFENAPALAHEAKAVSHIKQAQRFTIIIGNPPYSGISGNMSNAAQQLVDRYRYINGKPLGERKLWLQNDYVKFIGLAHRLILDAGVGCLGYITDNSYLDGPTFRGVRSNLLQDFSTIFALNLHGNTKKKNSALEAKSDENVFDITQGVAIINGLRASNRTSRRFCTTSLIGTRGSKYEKLAGQSAINIEWVELVPTPPFFQFANSSRDGEAEYNGYYSIKAAFPLNSVGIQTSRDHLAIDFTKQELVSKVRDFSSSKVRDADIRERYFPGKKVGGYPAGDTRSWRLSSARKELQNIKNLDSNIIGINYRPFDFRFVFNSTLLVDWPRPEVSEQMNSGKNLGLCLLRRTENARSYDYFSVSRSTISNHQVSLKDGTYLLPLYVESTGGGKELFSSQHHRQPNLSLSFLKAIATTLGLQQTGKNGLPSDTTPEDILHYAYAVFYSPNYRKRYAEFLKMDFPRLPLPGSQDLFRQLANIGGKLVGLHLLEAPEVKQFITEVMGGRKPEVEKVSWTNNTVWLDKAKSGGFKGVREDVWNFQVGGYQVCEKWLKDRKGRTLSKDDIAHYQKIIVALSETIRLMKEIDEVIKKHGGWPGAFASAKDLKAQEDPKRPFA